MQYYIMVVSFNNTSKYSTYPTKFFFLILTVCHLLRTLSYKVFHGTTIIWPILGSSFVRPSFDSLEEQLNAFVPTEWFTWSPSFVLTIFYLAYLLFIVNKDVKNLTDLTTFNFCFDCPCGLGFLRGLVNLIKLWK